MEGFILEMAKGVIRLMALISFLSLALFTFQVGDTTSFKQTVSYQIERHGGLTEAALININNYSQTHYGGRYSVISSQLNEQVQFGEVVEYTVIGKYKPMYLPIEGFEIPSQGSAISLVRKK